MRGGIILVIVDFVKRSGIKENVKQGSPFSLTLIWMYTLAGSFLPKWSGVCKDPLKPCALFVFACRERNVTLVLPMAYLNTD